MKRFTTQCFLWVVLLCLGLCSPCLALFDLTPTLSKVRLFEGEKDLSSQNVDAGLEITMKPEWKTYWRAPGAAGYPLKLTWQEQVNIKDFVLFWPTPSTFTTFGFTANGYKAHVVFPLKVSLKDPSKPARLKGVAEYLVCDPHNCIPQTKEFFLEIAPSDKPLKEDVALLQKAKAQLPKKASASLRITHAEFNQPDEGVATLTLFISHQERLDTPEMFLVTDKKVFFDRAVFGATTKDGNAFVTKVSVPVYTSEKKERGRVDSLVGSSVDIVLKETPQSIEQTVSITAPLLSWSAELLMYGFALLGGLILNFMPCVLPVIFLKVFSVLKEGTNREQMRKTLGLTVGGILTSFLVMGLCSLFFKEIGYALGWGLQFQEPFFLLFMMIILTLFAANFWGFYEINVSSKAANLSYAQTTKEGNLGHFMSGMFATFLATPCSAPYLGTAVSFALSRGITEILLIFLCLGIGLSVPFLLVMAFPRVAAIFPKPGPWMDTFRKLLGWGFILTLFWLLYVMNQQVSYKVVLLIATLLAGMLFLLWLAPKLDFLRKPYRTPILITLLVGLCVVTLYERKQETANPHPSSLQAQLALIKTSIAQGKSVFVCVTADWCLTCKANEYLVLDTKAFKEMLASYHTTYIVIDWTSRDPKVYDYLKLFGQEGIPFYAVYGPRNPYGKGLSQVLTSESVKRALEEVK